MRVLTVPGWTGSGPAHWQSLWERAHPEYRRVEQRDWDRPSRDEWVATIEAALEREEGAVCLVAHSLGCIAVAHLAARRHTDKVAGALLVAPADVDAPLMRGVADDFGPVPLQRLPFRSILIASSDDPYLPIERARALAAAWGSELVEVGAAGHINTDAGFGAWPEGEALLERVIAGERAG